MTLENDVAQKEVAEALGRLLADTVALYVKTHSYHWNVTGPMFPILHEMFERQYTELQSAVDPIAERIRALGHLAPGSLSEFARLTSVAEEQESDAMGMVHDLTQSHRVVAGTARELLLLAEKAGDVVSADLATSRLTTHDQEIWMLDATSDLSG